MNWVTFWNIWDLVSCFCQSSTVGTVLFLLIIHPFQINLNCFYLFWSCTHAFNHFRTRVEHNWEVIFVGTIFSSLSFSMENTRRSTALLSYICVLRCLQLQNASFESCREFSLGRKTCSILIFLYFFSLRLFDGQNKAEISYLINFYKRYDMSVDQKNLQNVLFFFHDFLKYFWNSPKVNAWAKESFFSYVIIIGF